MASERSHQARTRKEQLVLRYALEQPELGQFSVSQEAARAGIQISPSTVRNIWKRHGLETSYLRLMARSKAASHEPAAALSIAQQDLLKRERRNRRLAAQAKDQDESVSELRREQILQVAARLFATRTYAKTSLRAVCTAAGIQPASLYYHFKSKDDLFATVHRLGMTRVNEALDATAASSTDPWQRLEEVCATALRFQLDPTELAIIVRVYSGVRLNPALQKRIDADRASYERRFRELIDALPLHPKADKTLLRLTLLGALNWTHVWYRPGRLSPEDIGRQLIRIVFGYAYQRAPSTR